MEEFRGELITIDTWDEDFSIGSAKVMARSIPHSGNTLGFRIEADGRSMAYLPDHQAPLDRRTIPEGVLELCQGVDLLVHDGQYTDDEFASKATGAIRPPPLPSGGRRGPGQAAAAVPPRPVAQRPD